MKTLHFLKDVYYRGVVLITRKNKFLKRKMIREGRWTFKGFITRTNVEEFRRNEINTSTMETQTIHNNTEGTKDNRDIIINSVYDDENYGMDYPDQLDDFWSNVDYKDLVDIRINPSYFAFRTFLKQSQIDLSTNEYDHLSKEIKNKINTCATTYCFIFFRDIVESSIERLANFIFNFHISAESDKYDLHSDLNDEFGRVTELNNYIRYREKDIKLPSLKAFILKGNNSHIKPLLNIKLKCDNVYNIIRLEYTYDQVVDFFLKLVDQTISSFNNICTTHHMEFIDLPPTEIEKIQKQHWMKLNEIFSDNKVLTFSEDYFTNLCPNIIMEESKLQSYMKSYLRIAFANEDIFVGIKNKIGKHVKFHYVEMEESLKIFEPLRDLISNNLLDDINNFIEIESKVIDYNKYTHYIDKLRQLQRYICTIPNSIFYPMFAIDSRESKIELNKRVNDLLSLIFKKLEDNIISVFNDTIDNYQKLHKMVDKRLYTPEDLVEMEKIKSTVLSSELNNILHDYNEASKIYFYLLSVDNIFTEAILNKTEETVKCHLKFKKDYEE
jgi:hypothetical protein